MKKIIASLLAAVLVLSLTACSQPTAEKTGSEKDSPKPSSKNELPSAVSSSTSLSSEPDFSQAEDFDDIADIIDASDVEIDLTENEDGSVSVDLKRPDTEIKPAIPTLPKKDEEQKDEKADEKKPEPEPTPTPTPTPEPEKKPDSTPEPAPEPEPEPTPTPTLTPEPQPPVIDTKAPYRGYTYTANQKHTALSSTERYLYSILNSEQKEWYRAIDKAVRGFEKDVKFDINISENRNYYIYFIYMFDNPEHFYLGNTCTIHKHGDGTSSISLCYSDGVEYCTYGHNPSCLTPELKASILKKKAVFDAEVKRIVSTIPSDAPDVVKERLIYDRILLDSHYNLGAKWNGICEPNWNAYGIIINKYGVCESYSEAFQVLLNAVGIQCTGIVGTAGGGHKWNAVKLDGEWYACDVTFDDPIGGDPDDAYHYYFNLTTKEMEEERHYTDGSDYPGPDCTGTKYAYKNCFD